MNYDNMSFSDNDILYAADLNNILSDIGSLDNLINSFGDILTEGGVQGAQGVGIVSIEKPSNPGTAGATDIYTINLSDGSKYTFSVYNGKDGKDGSNGTGGSGTSVSNAEIDASGHLIITLSNGSTIDAGMAKGDTGPQGARGNRWYTGTAITGVDTNAKTFTDSEVAQAYYNDLYLNTTYYRIYQCVYSGAPADAKWVYIGSIKGVTGANGKDGADSISDASVNANGYLVLTLSNGNTLTAGKVLGNDGYSPIVSVSNVENGKYIEIKSMDEGLVKTDGFYLYHGTDGATPVRGSDYWTAADIAEIKSYVDDAILGGEW